MTRAQPLNVASAFTPGPWESTATVAMHDRPDLPCVVDQFRLVVAQCWDDGHSEDECEANARLIAAAPDLLAAGQEAVDAITALTGTIPEDQLDAIMAAYSSLRRAISKARAEA